jgi:hypothetical protein
MGRGWIFRHCERSEAIQRRRRGLDCFVANAPRNDESTFSVVRGLVPRVHVAAASAGKVICLFRPEKTFLFAATN